MAALITLPDHDMDGIAHLNNNFEYLDGLAKQAMNQANNNGQFNDWSKDGIVTHNGFSLENDSGYRYWQLPNGWKLVEIIISSKLSTSEFPWWSSGLLCQIQSRLTDIKFANRWLEATMPIKHHQLQSHLNPTASERSANMVNGFIHCTQCTSVSNSEVSLNGNNLLRG